MQNLRKLLLPFAWLYGGIVGIRNKLFDWGWLSTKKYDFPVISVGNISVGGTGKSPMIEYLIVLLKNHFNIATLSRGYRRQTKGYYLLQGTEKATETGDEPLQFKTKFPSINVAVDEDRQNGIAQLRRLPPRPEVILLDDAFQHRKVTPGLSILLTTYEALYKKDLVLPAGNLREPRSGAKRANIIVVSKCPDNLSIKAQQQIKDRLNLKPCQSLYFSFIDYADFLTNRRRNVDLDQLKNNFCLVTGVAKPSPLVRYLKDKGFYFQHLRFPDHHNFTKDDLETLRREDLIITTEKDFMRLKSYLSLEKLFYLSIKQKFIKGEKEFDQEIINFVKKYKK